VVQSRVRAIAATIFVVTACEPSRPVEAPLAWTVASATAPSASPATTPPTTSASSVDVKVLFAEPWRGSVTLVGVDPANLHAVLRYEGHAPEHLSFETIDLREGKKVSSWVATPERARESLGRPFFRGLSGPLLADSERFAELLVGLGPWHARPALSTPTCAVSARKGRFVFGAPATDGSDGDWLFAGDPGSRRLDSGLRASYAPVFDPSGNAVAFVGCQTSPCDYGLFITRFDEGRPRRIPGIHGASNPQWQGDESLLTIGTQGKDRCLFRAPVHTGFPSALRCLSAVEDASFVQDADERTAVISGVRGSARAQRVDLAWVLLADGSLLAEHSMERAVGASALSDSGLLALPMQRGAVGVVDLVGGTSAVLGEDAGWFFGFDGARWLGDSLVLLRKIPDRTGFELVLIDARSLASSSASAPLSSGGTAPRR
jgi:hypothetical protein